MLPPFFKGWINLKKLISAFITFLILLTPLHTFAQHSQNVPVLISPTEDYLEYCSLPEDEKKDILAPLPFEIASQIQERITTFGLSRNTTLPQKYDLRDENLLTPVKNQGALSVCWSFSGLSLLESSLLNQTSKSYDFSEMHAAYYMSENAFIDGTNEYGWDRTAGGGGNLLHMASYLYSGLGPVDEADFPFDASAKDIYLADVQDKPLADVRLNDMGLLASEVSMKETPSEIDNFKNILYSNGPLSTGIYLDANSNENYYNAENYSFYYPDEINPNHAVTLVGWDDTYSKENFSSVPEGDGAWIVRNSWGSDVMEEGYFYLSYYQPLYNTYFFYDVQNELGYDNIYSVKQNSETLFASDIEYAANVFTKTQGTQTLSEIVVMTSGATDYEVYVNPNVSESDIFPQEIKNNCVAEGTIEHAGYKTIELKKPITLTGEKFAVIVKYSDSYIPVTNLTSSSGKGLLSADGNEWYTSVEIDNETFAYDCVILAYTKDVDKKANVVFSKTPYYAQITLSENGGKITPNQGGIYSLLPGTYTYSAKAEGLVDTPLYTFTITDTDCTTTKTIEIKLNKYKPDISVSGTSITATVTAPGGINGSNVLIIAQYDKNMSLVSQPIILELSELTKNSDTVYTYNGTIQNITSGDTFKAYVWDNMQNISPLSYAATCTT